MADDGWARPWDMFFYWVFLVKHFRKYWVEDSHIYITYQKCSAAVFLLKFTYVICFCKRLTTPNMDHMLKIQHDLHPTGSTKGI